MKIFILYFLFAYDANDIWLVKQLMLLQNVREPSDYTTWLWQIITHQHSIETSKINEDAKNFVELGRQFTITCIVHLLNNDNNE